MQNFKVWDPLVRLFHWSLVAGFLTNALWLDAQTKLHRQIGYGLLILVGLRLVWGLVGSKHARFRDFPPSAPLAIGQLSDIANGRVRLHLGHTPLGALMIYNLLAGILAIGLTGWMMTTDAYWGIGWVEDTHKLLVNWVGFSAGLHVIAVIWESRRTGINLPRAMVTGVKRVPEAMLPDPLGHTSLIHESLVPGALAGMPGR